MVRSKVTVTKRQFLETQREQRRDLRDTVSGRGESNPVRVLSSLLAIHISLAPLGPRTRLRTSPVEGLHVAVLGWHGHAAQVRLVAHRLEVAAAQQKVYRARAAPLRQRQRLIDLVQLAVAAASHSHPHPASPGRG